jgi:DNA-binding CsgD family transcriptional regulator
MKLKNFIKNEVRQRFLINNKPVSYKVKLVLLMGLILILLLILAIVNDIYMKKIADSPEIIYRQTTEGTIEIGLMKEQLSEILTLYALGLNEKCDFNIVKNLTNDTIINLATLIAIYPDDDVLSEISNLMIKAIRILESAEKDGFSWPVMKDLQTIDQRIKADLVKFRASKRLSWSSTVSSYENFLQNSKNIYLAILIICCGIICLIGYIVFRSFQKIPSNSIFVKDSSNKPKQTSEKSNDLQLINSLTDREKEILVLIAQGYDNREIARRVYMAEQTIKNYVSEIYSKLGVRGRVQASLKAIEVGLTEVQEKSTKD